MTALDAQMDSVRPFIILSSQRSGSTFVRIWLNRHSKIHCYGEVFLGHYESADGFRAYCEQNTWSRWLFRMGCTRLARALRLELVPRCLVEDYLNVLYYGKSHPPPWTDIADRVNPDQARERKPVIGFKVMYNTLAQYRSLEKWLLEQRPRVIHLTRDNLLRKYTSMVRMSITRVAHSKAQLPDRQKVNIDVDKFIEFARIQAGLVAEYRGRLKDRMPYLELSYEGYFSDTDQSKKAILDFLEVEDEEMPFHNMKKIGSSRLSDDIENWGEVASRLGDTPYAIYLESPVADGKNYND